MKKMVKLDCCEKRNKKAKEKKDKQVHGCSIIIDRVKNICFGRTIVKELARENGLSQFGIAPKRIKPIGSIINIDQMNPSSKSSQDNQKKQDEVMERF